MNEPITPVVSAPVGRRRRPSGEPPPLPRHVDASTRWFVILIALTAALWVCLRIRPSLEVITRADLVVVRAAARLRTPALTSIMRALDGVRSPWTVRLIAWATIMVLLAFRRFQHLAAYLLVFLGVSLTTSAVGLWLGRMRPAGVAIVGRWDGYAHPSKPVAALALVLTGALYTLVPGGHWRNTAKWAAGAPLVLVSVARLYLGTDHPTDLLAALVVGWAVPVVVFRMMTPDEVFPVSYRPGRRAHLDVGGARGDAIVRALAHQLGIDVRAIEPFGLEGSAGSTPLRLHVRVAGGGETVLFAKLYALTHLRSDRWYKLVRTIVYGRLEDEKPFNTVRRLVEYEDHMLRLMRDSGLPVPHPYGFVEITPEREYLIVMEFFEGARELRHVAAAQDTIDDALAVVRRLWDGGLAHRDLKPSNVLVRDGRALLIDVAFTTARPTPWRQAVDLANMMLTLSLSCPPELVYERSLRFFAADDVAEAFAASRSVTIPSQLRAMIRSDGRDLVTAFRRLAPARRPVSIQLWNVRRVGLTLGALAGTAGVVTLVAIYARVAGLA